MKKWILLLIVFTIGLSAIAHEYILLAYQYKLAKGDTLEMHLFVADGFNIQLERPMQTGITKRFQLITKNGTTDLKKEAKEGALPIVNRQVDWEGLGLLVLDRDYSRITLPANEFRSYLKEDHIDDVNLSDIDTSKAQRERYTRYIKSLVLSGTAGDSDTLYRQLTGQKFEILLMQNPYLLKPGDVLTAKLLFEGKPLAHKIITARNRTGSEASVMLTSRTDRNGICSFTIAKKGEWFLHATHLVAVKDKGEADWESFWASYSFGVL